MDKIIEQVLEKVKWSIGMADRLALHGGLNSGDMTHVYRETETRLRKLLGQPGDELDPLRQWAQRNADQAIETEVDAQAIVDSFDAALAQCGARVAANLQRLRDKIKWWEDTCNSWRKDCEEARVQRDSYADLSEDFRLMYQKEAEQREAETAELEALAEHHRNSGGMTRSMHQGFADDLQAIIDKRKGGA